MAELRAYLQDDPNDILVLVGPRNSGKTQFIKRLLVKQPSLLGRSGSALYINARSTTITSAADLKNSLASGALGFFGWA